MECQLADETTAVCYETIKETQITTERNKNEVDYFLNAKLKQIDFIIDELKLQNATLNVELDATVPYINKLQKTKESLSYPKQITIKCRHFRNNVAINNLRLNTVEIHLTREIDQLNNACTIIQGRNDEIKEQLRKYRSLIYHLDRTIEKKERARIVEKQNLELGTSKENMFVSEYPLLVLSKYTVNEWNYDSERLLNEIRDEIERGRKLRIETDTMIRNLVGDLQHQYSICNDDFLKCIELYKERKNELEREQIQLNRQIKKMKQNIEELQTAIADKKPFIAIACTRINNRKLRPGIELCRDDVEEKLFNEICCLNDTNYRLMENLTLAQLKLSDLYKAEEEKKSEIAKFTLLIKIDEVECLTIRNTVHFHHY